MPFRSLALQDKTTTRYYRVELIRTEILVGAHFYDEALSKDHPISFVVSTSEHEPFSKYAAATDEALFDICIKEFINPQHIERVNKSAPLGVSVGRRLP
jgi:hypothetical protein